MFVRLAFQGFNTSLARLAESLASSREVRIVGMVADDIPSDWPDSLDQPQLFTEYKELISDASPDLLLVAGDTEELADIPGECQVVSVHEEAPAGQLLGLLAGIQASRIVLEDEIREIASLSASLNVIEAYTDPMPKLTQLLDRAAAVCDADMGLILLPGEVLDELNVVLARGEGMDRLVGEGLNVTGSLSGEAFDTGRPVQGEIGEDIEEIRYLKDTGLSRLFAFPMRAEGRIIGIFALGRREEEEFGALKMTLLSLLADQAGLAVQISRLYSELEANVVLDSASGLYNQHYFHQRMSEEVSRARRYSLNVCLVVLEIDDFDAYMEKNGRFMGDLILSDVGNVIKRNTREVDTAARYGDNKFTILLPETRRLGAMRLAERIRKVIEEYPFPSREKKEVEKLTICAGISSFPANAENDNELLEKAFMALLAAREAGPNNIRLFSDNMTEENST